MLAFLGRRLTAGVVLVFAITTLAYLLLYLGSGDIARRILGQTATQEQVAAKTTELGLDRPLWEQYAGWLSGAFTGDLGRSWFTGPPSSFFIFTVKTPNSGDNKTKATPLAKISNPRFTT